MRLFLLLLLVSCTTLTEREIEERDYNREIDRQNWEMCQRVYRRFGIPTISRHSHKGAHKPHEVRQDLSLNKCKRLLGVYWADRI